MGELSISFVHFAICYCVMVIYGPSHIDLRTAGQLINFFIVILKNVCSILLAFFTLSCWKFKYHVNGDLSVFEQHYYLVFICRP